MEIEICHNTGACLTWTAAAAILALLTGFAVLALIVQYAKLKSEAWATPSDAHVEGSE
jgi:hypothetical protein